MSDSEKRTITAEDLYRFNLVSHAELSPDGLQVVYALQRVDEESEKKYSNLWVVPAEGGEPRQFTMGDQVDAQPRWSPDGKSIAFISNRQEEKQPQLYLIPFGGGEARKLTDLQGEFGSFEWSPDGKRLVLQFRKKDPEAIEREKDEKKKELGVVYRRIDRLFYSEDAVGWYPRERWHLWIIDVETGEATQLTEGAVYDETFPSWSPDGEEIVFLSNRTEDPDLDPDYVDLFVIPAEGGEMRRIDTPIGVKQHPVYSPDGRWIAYLGREGRSDWWKNTLLWVVPAGGAAGGSGEARDLTGQHDITASGFTLNDIGSVKMMPPTWSPDGRTLYVQMAQHGRVMLDAVSVEDGSLETLVEGEGVVGVYNFDAGRERLMYFWGEMQDPVQLYLYELNSGESRRLTHLNAFLDEIDLGNVEEVWFEGADGNELQGWILKPPGFDPEKRYPSILEIHGGPLGQYGFFFMHEFYYLAAQGYVVYFSNPRGGIGYGEEHAEAIWGGWGAADYADLMAWADYVEGESYIDPECMGVTGGSYGGYMTAWIIGHTDRFEAAVAQRSVTNLISMWGSSDGNWIFQRPFGDKAPYESIEGLWASSPMKHVGNAKTPTLVIHSEQDLRCPLEQGQQLFVALKTLGVDTEFIVFPGEPHGLSRMGRTDRRIARLEAIGRWFATYLKDRGEA
ncbi:MAG: S9 family peptidase [Anaerolineales bacterium]